MEGVVHFIQNRRLELMELIGSPPKPDLFFKLQPHAVRSTRGCRGLSLKLLKETGNAPLFMAHCMANDLRWVGCKDQTDIEFLEQRFKLGWGNVETSQALK